MKFRIKFYTGNTYFKEAHYLPPFLIFTKESSGFGFWFKAAASRLSAVMAQTVKPPK
jgi:hypothetical protein